MKKPWQFATSGDLLTILLLLTLSLAGIAWVATRPEGTRVVATCDGEVCFTASLDLPQSVMLDGPLGQTRLVIEEQTARITSSPCPRKTCIAMGTARSTGELLACVPNHILVRIDSPAGTEEPYDLLSR